MRAFFVILGIYLISAVINYLFARHKLGKVVKKGQITTEDYRSFTLVTIIPVYNTLCCIIFVTGIMSEYLNLASAKFNAVFKKFNWASFGKTFFKL